MLQQQDYNCIGIVAKHCDNEKLCTAEQQAIDFDLSELFCEFWYDILAYWNEVDAYDNNPQLPIPENYEQKKALIYGGTFENCSGRSRGFYGVKRILAYYSYARYVIINSVSDTPTGLVKKTSDFAIQLNQKEMESLSNQYRNMGFQTFETVSSYLCNQRDIFTLYNSGDCKGCGCNCEKCGGTTKAKGFGMKGSNINKRL